MNFIWATGMKFTFWWLENFISPQSDSPEILIYDPCYGGYDRMCSVGNRGIHRGIPQSAACSSHKENGRDVEANIRQACIYINIILLYYVCHSIAYYVLVLLLRFSYYGYSSVWLRQRYYRNHTFIISTTATAGRWYARSYSNATANFRMCHA